MQNIYDQLIDIALLTKDIEWAKELYHEKLYGKPVFENEFAFELSDIYFYTYNVELKFTYIADDLDKYLQLAHLLDKKLEVTIKNDSIIQQYTIEFNDMDIKRKRISISIPIENNSQAKEVYKFIHEKIKLSFRLI